MSFKPPPDYTKVALAAVVGGALGLGLLIVTQDRTPHVGDNIHHLPHGGAYRDGNKAILYAGPGRQNAATQTFYPAISVLVLSALIALSHYCHSRNRCACRHPH